MRRPLPLLRFAAPLLGALAALVATRPAAAEEPQAEFSARHILVSWKGSGVKEATRTKEEAKAIAEKVLAELKKPGADFASLSHTYSDDRVSDERSGFLGLFGPGAMTPAFESAVKALKDGEISGLVETEFGYHVIQRLSIADALVMIKMNTGFVIGAFFSYEGTAKGPKSSRPKDKALADATKASALLKDGARFDLLPAEIGAAPLRPGWLAQPIEKGKVLPDFHAILDTTFALAEGKASDPFDSPLGFIVLRRLPFFRGHYSHLLVMHAKSDRCPAGITRTRDEAKARAEEALKRIRAEPASWAKVVAETSDDPSNAPKGGALGLVEPGHMVGEFDEGVATLKPGEVSGLIESRFGFHIVRKED